jgi:formylglycine-generating enzyme required for sulfatase activity
MRLAAIAWGADMLHRPPAHHVRFQPARDILVGVGDTVLLPAVTAHDADGHNLPKADVHCTSNGPGVLLHQGRLSGKHPGVTSVSCQADGRRASVRVRVARTYRSPSTDYAFIEVPAGTFTMGASPTDPDRPPGSVQHVVHITRPFFLATTEVTQLQWARAMLMQRSAPEYFGFPLRGSLHPAQNLSWCEALAFANALSRMDGLTPAYILPGGVWAEVAAGNCELFAGAVIPVQGADGYRLPTEAEWEYAARAGTTDPWAGAASEDALCEVANLMDASVPPLTSEDIRAPCDDGADGSATVASRAPNGFGLYDMTGNVWEWVWDLHGSYPREEAFDPTGPTEGTEHTFRGGCWFTAPAYGKVTARVARPPTYRSPWLGLRLARSIPD